MKRCQRLGEALPEFGLSGQVLEEHGHVWLGCNACWDMWEKFPLRGVTGRDEMPYMMIIKDRDDAE